MRTIDVKEQVRQAIRSEWPAFEAEHPRLAAVMDETLLLPAAVAALDEDEEFRAAMEQAAAIGAAGEVVASLVSRVVRQWLRQLI